MHVHVPEKYRSPISSWCLSFLKSWSVDSKLRWLFHSCLLKSLLESWTFGRVFLPSYFYVLHPLSQGLPILPDIFLKKEIMKPTLPCVFDCPPSLIMPPKCSNWVYFGVRLCESKFGFFCTMKCFHAKFLELPSYSNQKNHFDIGSK